MDIMVHLGAHMHQAVTSLFGEPTMLKIVLHEVTFFNLQKSWCTLLHRCRCTNQTQSYGVHLRLMHQHLCSIVH